MVSLLPVDGIVIAGKIHAKAVRAGITSDAGACGERDKAALA